jgi:hypothetical protein
MLMPLRLVANSAAPFAFNACKEPYAFPVIRLRLIPISINTVAFQTVRLATLLKDPIVELVHQPVQPACTL